MAYLLLSLIKLTIEELANIVLDYQHKFGNSLGSINAELLEINYSFNILKHKCKVNGTLSCYWTKAASEQYSKRECLEILGIPESVISNAVEDKIQGVLCGIDAEVHTENIESCHRLKGKGSKGRVILKRSKRKDTEKIKLNKKKLKNIDHKNTGLSSGMKVFINQYIHLQYIFTFNIFIYNEYINNIFINIIKLWSICKELFLEKKIASFWVTNGTVKIKFLNDQFRSITHEADLSALTHEGPLVGTDRNE